MKMPNYYSNWKTDTFNCLHCNWSGPGAECVQGEDFNDLVEMDCPKCRENIFNLIYPTEKEIEQNWEKVSEAAKKLFLIRKQQNKDFSDGCLRSPKQLPDLMGDDLVLTWDIEDRNNGGNTLIKWGERVIWRETAWYECYERFIEVAHILKEKYQDQLQDLVPTRKSIYWLLGDRLTASSKVESCRSTLGLYDENEVQDQQFVKIENVDEELPISDDAERN